MKSMTGFGQAHAGADGLTVGVTVRTLNHKFLDLVVRAPEELREFEPEIRRRVGTRLQRGRVELRFDVEFAGDPGVEIEVSEKGLAEVRRAVEELSSRGLPVEVALGDLLRFPELVAVRSTTERPEALPELTLNALEEALDQVVALREEEGAALAGVLSERLAELRAEIEALSSLRSQAVERWRGELGARLEELIGTTVSEERLVQEVALWVEKSDVREELDRLSTHLDSLAQALASDEPVGRRLDFLSQEILRELNTTAAKCRDGEMGERTVEAKLLCEQIREQVQNVE